MENKFLDKLFEELKYLNKVPKFQIERAISPFLGIFISDIANSILDSNISIVIPEFPLKKKGNKQSTNIDWLLVDEVNRILYCIELKTDKYSYNEEQSKIYKVLKAHIEEKGASFLLKNLSSIKSKSKRPEKYETVFQKFAIKMEALKEFRKLIIVYLVPFQPPVKSKIYCDKVILFSELPPELAGTYKPEWSQLRDFLISISS